MVTDALSRRLTDEMSTSASVQSNLHVSIPSMSTISNVSPASEGTLCIISFPTPAWLSDLKNSYTSDTMIQSIMQAIQSGSDAYPGFTLCNKLLFYKGKLYLGEFSGDLKSTVLHQVHDSPLGGHSGYLKALQRLQRDFYWFGLRKDLKQYVKECDVCQKLKHETCFPAGLLQPLPIPEKPWLDVNMDFVEGLSKSHMQSVVLVVVDRLTKYTHFMALSHPYTAAKVANVYLQSVFKLHGMPSTIVSDRDPIFTSHFWRELMRLQGVALTMSSSYHPQTNGQTKVVNKSYINAFAADKPTT